MKSTFRATTKDDLPNICAFLQRVFETGPHPAFLAPEVMLWKYWAHRDDWTEPRSYVLEKGSSIVAHAGIWPVTFGGGAQAIRGLQIIDWAAAKDSPGAGLTLVQKLAAMFDFIYSVGGSEATQKVLPAFGFVKYAREWNGARPIRPVRQILTHQTRNWKLAPRLLRNYFLSKHKTMHQNDSWQAEEIAAHQIAADLVSPQASFSPRTPAFFKYLVSCPVTRFHCYRIRNANEQQGHFAIGVLRGQARLAGVWLRDTSPQSWRMAYTIAQRTAANLPCAYEFVAAGTEGASAEAAALSGLRITRGSIVYLLNKPGRLNLPQDFQFQLSDHDGVFLDSGKPSYWT